MNILIYDAYSSPLKTKEKLINIIKHKSFVTEVGYNSFSNGVKTDQIIDLFRHKLHYVLIWNGREIGCEYIVNLCKKYNTPYCYFEQGFLPQKETLSFYDNKEKKLNKYFNPNITDDWIKEIKNKISPNFQKKDYGRGVVIPLQLFFDTSLSDMWEPRKNFFDSIFREISFRELTEEEITFCPHPRMKNIYDFLPLVDYRTDSFFYNGCRAKVSEKTFLEEIKACKTVIGYNSTSLYEARALGIPTISIFDGNFSTKFLKDDCFWGAIKNHQINVMNSNVGFKDFLKIIETNKIYNGGI